MLGLMQDRPLTLAHVFHRAEQLFGHKTLVTATADGETETTLAEWAHRVRRLATALDALGVSADGRVGTFCWNTARHLELYCAAPCTGRVLHTLNIRLFPEQLVYIVEPRRGRGRSSSTARCSRCSRRWPTSWGRCGSSS